MNTRSRRSRGFSLIELMITVVIVAILASIAIPSYSTYVLRSHRTEAKTALLDMASMEERWLTTNGQYTSNPANLGFAGAGVPVDLIAQPMKVGSNYYQVQIPAALGVAAPGSPPTVATFTITAVPLPGSPQVNDTACASFTVTSTGARQAFTSGGVDNTATCW
jgi:type IV pilus assembly protein PilE